MVVKPFGAPCALAACARRRADVAGASCTSYSLKGENLTIAENDFRSKMLMVHREENFVFLEKFLQLGLG